MSFYDLNCSKCGGEIKSFQGSHDIFECSYCRSKYIFKDSKIQPKFELKINNSVIKIIFIPFLFFLFGSISYLAYLENKDIQNKKITSLDSLVIQDSSLVSNNIEFIENKVDVSASLSELVPLKDSIGNTYFHAICKNSGSNPIDKPSVQINLFNEKNELLQSYTGFGFKTVVVPGDYTAIKILASDTPKYTRLEIEFKPSYSNYIPESVPMKIYNTKLNFRPNDLNSYEILGYIENITEFKAKFVSINAILYDKEEKIINTEYTFINKEILQPNEKAIFKISFHNVPRKPIRYELEWESRKIE